MYVCKYLYYIKGSMLYLSLHFFLSVVSWSCFNYKDNKLSNSLSLVFHCVDILYLI